MSRIDGLLLVDKPAGPTSFGVIEMLRRTLAADSPITNGGSRSRDRDGAGSRRFRLGHAGTLDPIATGLLVVMAGRATRLAPFLMGLDKTYVTEIGFGVGTDTLDREGRVVARADVTADPAALRLAGAEFVGVSEQTPPVYSALKRAGKPLYARARAGEEVAPPQPRKVRIGNLAIEPGPWGEPAPPLAEATTAVAPDGRVYTARVTLTCSSGTYVRAFARDLAEALGTVGHVRELRRLAVGPFSVTQALEPDTLDDVEALRSAARLLAGALPHVPVAPVDWSAAERLRQGIQPAPDWRPPVVARGSVAAAVAVSEADKLLQIHDPAGDLVAICRQETSGGWCTAAVFPVS